jgi:hypothetical protein
MATILSIYLNKYLKQLSWWNSLLYLKTYVDHSVFTLFKIYVFKQKLGIRNIIFTECC